jgi:prepilin-type N-terminal cleavage/methylation domain-containing protein
VKKNHSQNGFTLIEILVTVFILLLMLVFYASSLSTMRLTRIMQHKDIALRVLEEKMETLRGGGYANLPASGTFTNTLLDSLPGPSASTTISLYNATTKEILVGVSWIDSGTTYYVSLSSLITEIGGL